jgi:hypothetical protein
VTFLIDTAGWISALLILAGYILVSTGRLTGQSQMFQWMNIAGAGGFVVYAGWHQTWPTMMLNVIWCIIGIATIFRISRQIN